MFRVVDSGQVNATANAGHYAAVNADEQIADCSRTLLTCPGQCGIININLPTRQHSQQSKEKGMDNQKQLNANTNTNQAASTNQSQKKETQMTEQKQAPKTEQKMVWRLVKDYGWNGGDPIEYIEKVGRYIKVKHVDAKGTETVWKVRSSSIEQVPATEAKATAAA